MMTILMKIRVDHLGFNLHFPEDQRHWASFAVYSPTERLLRKVLLMFLGHVNRNGLPFSSLLVGIPYRFSTQAIFRMYVLSISSAPLFTSLLS